ncbi:c-type cytochrome biogenesis protein CcmI [Dactylosporangium sp. NPDC049140]|uniref:c-type cytochrome biogenesis protein CcmI n=1 Tax=Dactylosporangium sp. NPDC049140 TaxID=3155647 RepID=UPI003411829A
MGLVSAILTAPLAPVRVAVWVGELIRDEVDRQLYDPTVIRRQLGEVDEDRAAGRIDPAEADRRQRELIGRLIRPDRQEV